jgi:hypothetical protein
VDEVVELEVPVAVVVGADPATGAELPQAPTAATASRLAVAVRTLDMR